MSADTSKDNLPTTKDVPTFRLFTDICAQAPPEEDVTPPKVGRKLQIVTIGPLLAGIIIAVIICLIFLFSEYLNWTKDAKTYLIDQELQHLQRVASARAQTLSSYLSNIAQELEFLSEVKTSVENNSITLSSQMTIPSYVNARTDTETSYPQLKKSEWYAASTSTTLDNSATYYYSTMFVDMLARVIYNNTDDIHQIGTIIDRDAIDFRYPLENMTYVNQLYNFTETCAKQNVIMDPRCTETYAALLSAGDSVVKNLMVYFEYTYLNIFRKYSIGAIAQYSPNDAFFTYMNLYSDYTYFLTHYEGLWVLAIDQNSYKDFEGKDVWNALFPDDPELAQKVQDDIIPEMKNYSTGSQEISSSSSDKLMGYAPLDIATGRDSDEKNLAVGVYISRAAVLNDYNDMTHDLLIIIVIMLIIFFIFLLVTILCAIMLAFSITHRLLEPMQLMESCLKGTLSLNSISKNYNAETNVIFKYLRMVQVQEAFIYPRFLLHPRLEIRIQNLKAARKFFKMTENRRGYAITNNLLGNDYFQKKNYLQAINAYSKSLKSMEDLLKKVEKQEEDEKSLTPEERAKLQLDIGKNYSGWEPEKEFLRGDITQRLMQLCMAKMAYLEEESAPVVELRADWKELLELMTRALDYYIATATRYEIVLKLLIDMSYVFQNLQYYHSATELLDLINETLWRLDSGISAEADIDTIRLRRIGIFTKDQGDGKMIHFNVSGLSHEKDILWQQLFYRTAIIMKENDKYTEAAYAFTQAIEKGTVYDPAIRRAAIREMYGLINKFGMLNQCRELKQIYKAQQIKKRSILFVFYYDVSLLKTINQEIVKWIGKEIEPENQKIGAMLMSMHENRVLDIIERDFPSMDIDHLFVRAQYDTQRDYIYDVIMRGYRMFGNDSNEKYIVLFVKSISEKGGSAVLLDLDEIADKDVQLIAVQLDDPFPVDLDDFLRNKTYPHIVCDQSVEPYSKTFSKIHDLIFSSTDDL
ncbi:unnamed protein product [Blepharisma stoltei]|uniref:Tetratricopeptide repeat protein n=1 Tax=Blepharisma stoltei TaxID=1481888 RepID=A0AAU9JNW7_9CILI|nr:unnamed protein product [Blepharisma stoltei]